MADTKDAPAPGASSSSAPKVDGAPKVDAKAAPKQNPVFKMMGIPNFRRRLPSRNWMIFWTVVGSWFGAVYYDRREKKRIQKRWCDAVAHLAREPLQSNVMQRKLTIFLSAPPADGLLNAREHFHEYVRPILQSAGLNWDAIEGRREGDVRAAFSEWLRKRRKVAGEASNEPVEEDDLESMIEDMRGKMNVREWPGAAGDIVIGRNTWKEYVRGLHEGWLGPVDAPEHVTRTLEEADKPSEESKKETTSEATPSTSTEEPTTPSEEGTVIHDTFDAQTEEKKEPEKPKEEENKPKKPKQPLPFISTSDYARASLPPSLPSELPPATAISFPHLLGFLNTPIRIYRYLNKRKMADDIGREAAAACFAAYRPFERSSGPVGVSPFSEDDASPSSSPHQEEGEVPHSSSSEQWEQEGMLKHEEADWHKSVRKNHDASKESVWVDTMVLDPRIAGRMRKFYLDEADVERGLAAEEESKKAEESKEDSWF